MNKPQFFISRILKRNIKNYEENSGLLHLKLTETGELYFNNSHDKNIKISDIEFIDVQDDILSLVSPNENKLYVARDTGAVMYIETDSNGIKKPVLLFKSTMEKIAEIQAEMENVLTRVEAVEGDIIIIEENVKSAIEATQDLITEKISDILSIDQF